MAQAMVSLGGLAFASSAEADEAVAAFHARAGGMRLAVQSAAVRWTIGTSIASAQWEPLVAALSELAAVAVIGSAFAGFELDGWYAETRIASGEAALHAQGGDAFVRGVRVTNERRRLGVERADETLATALYKGHEAWRALALSEPELRVAFTALVAQQNVAHALERKPRSRPVLVGDLNAEDFDELHRIVGSELELLCSSSLSTTPEFRARAIELLAGLARAGSTDAANGIVDFAVWDKDEATRDHAVRACMTIDPAMVAAKCRYYLCKPAKFDAPVMCRAAVLLGEMPDHPAVKDVAREASRRRVADPAYAAALRTVLAK